MLLNFSLNSIKIIKLLLIVFIFTAESQTQNISDPLKSSTNSQISNEISFSFWYFLTFSILFIVAGMILVLRNSLIDKICLTRDSEEFSEITFNAAKTFEIETTEKLKLSNKSNIPVKIIITDMEEVVGPYVQNQKKY